MPRRLRRRSGRIGRPGRLGRLDDSAARQVNDPVSDGLRTLELVRGEHDGATSGPGTGEKLVEKITAVLIESSMRLVEQPQPRTARYEHRK